VAYIATTGEMIIQPDGIPIGIFDIRSAKSIFTGDTIFPPHELLPSLDTASRKTWGTQPVNALNRDFSVGVIAPSGLSLAYVLDDLTLTASGGFGTPTLVPDLVYIVPEPSTLILWGMAFLVHVGRRQSPW
jgi:hypothetical protein